MAVGTLDQHAVAPAAASVAAPAPVRLHYIDWLRVLAVLLLFPFHTLRVFNAGEPWYVKAHTLSMAVTYLLDFISAWHMQLLFLLAGVSTFFALQASAATDSTRANASSAWACRSSSACSCSSRRRRGRGAVQLGLHRLVLDLHHERRLLEMELRDGGDYYGGLGIGPALVHPHPPAGVPDRAAAVRVGPGWARRRVPAPLLAPPRPPRRVAAGRLPHLRLRGPARPQRARYVVLPRCSSCSATWPCATRRS